MIVIAHKNLDEEVIFEDEYSKLNTFLNTNSFELASTQFYIYICHFS